VALRQENSCTLSCKWIAGKSPKEHEEMSFVQKLEALYEKRHKETLQTARQAMFAAMFAAVISGILSGLLSGMLSGVGVYLLTRLLAK
jgi:hypothetical protein